METLHVKRAQYNAWNLGTIQEKRDWKFLSLHARREVDTIALFHLLIFLT